MMLKGFSYAMIGAFAGGLIYTILGTTQTIINL